MDREFRAAERAFEANPSYENALRLLGSYRRITSTAIEDFDDMRVLAYDIRTLGFPAGSQDFNRTIGWINDVSSFANSDLNIWERIVYIGMIREGANIANCFRIRRGYPDLIARMSPPPTPSALIPIIQRAVDYGAEYITFYTEGDDQRELAFLSTQR